MMPPIRIAVIDDHPLFREGVVRSLSELGGFSVVAEGGTVDDAVGIVAEHRPDIVLLDLSMAGGGLNAIPALRASSPSQKIVVLTVSESGEDVTRALQGGASGYVLKGVGARSLADILRSVAEGESYVSPSLSARLLAGRASAQQSPASGDPLGELSDREREILSFVAEGLSNKRIAIHLGLNEKTIKHHMSRVFAKLRVTNRTEAAMIFRDAREQRPVEALTG